jgi:hypothetical protein
MQREKRKIESSLKSKGFKQDDRDHHYFLYWTLDGKLTTIKTKTSHSSSKYKTINEPLIGIMAKQCCLERNDFLDLIDCPLKQKDYEIMLRIKGKI